MTSPLAFLNIPCTITLTKSEWIKVQAALTVCLEGAHAPETRAEIEQLLRSLESQLLRSYLGAPNVL